MTSLQIGRRLHLELVDTFRYLGVRINSKLTWTDHVSETKTKATCVLNLLRRSMQGCSNQAKARAYTALVRPHLETCACMDSLPSRRVPRMIWKRCKGVPYDIVNSTLYVAFKYKLKSFFFPN